MILTPVFVYFFLVQGSHFKEIALVIFLVAALTDWYDGWLARKFNYITNWGKFWDPMADKILTAGAFLSFVYLGELSIWLVIVILIRDFLVTTFRGIADSKGISFPTSKYAKWKTFIQMGFLYYMLIFYVARQHLDWGTQYKYIFDYALNLHSRGYYVIILNRGNTHKCIKTLWNKFLFQNNHIYYHEFY